MGRRRVRLNSNKVIPLIMVVFGAVILIWWVPPWILLSAVGGALIFLGICMFQKY